ncbi:MAG: hypothetical protein DWQ08_08140 [Proteobacteria bacterium]|nr:MAG: hypothetical protein DWQ08_08140 [Pseudomonadota bacterium]
MSALQKFIVKFANSRFGIPVKNAARHLRESYYNAEVLRRPVVKIAPLNVCIDSQAPRRVNLLIPEINFARFYGGYIAKFHLARKLVEAGHRVRVVTVDQCIEDLPSWRREIAAYDGLEGIFDRVEVACCFDRSAAVVMSPSDRVIATTWWTAYIANDLVGKLDIDRFVYLIQEYEPYTFPMGSYYAMANASYDFPHRALYSTRLLQEHFENHRIGHIHGHGAAGDDSYDYFENAIISYPDGEAPTRAAHLPRRLLFYARPEAHAARNMFEVGYLALSRAIEAGVFDDHDWSFHGIGSSHGDIPLPGGRTLEMLGKFGLREYKSRLLEYDLGLALMYTPHPSLLPLEMASAGMAVVTNSCQNKTREKMGQISSNLLTARPTIDGVAAELAIARDLAVDPVRRRSGARACWATDWEQALDARRMAKLERWLADS